MAKINNPGILRTTTINQHLENKKAPLQGLLGGLWQIRTVDLFRVKEAL